jgi:hypothetical protein
MLAGDRMVVRQGARFWWVFLLTGIAWLVIAWIVLRLNETSITTVGVLLGVVFIAAGVNEAGLVSGGWRFWYFVMRSSSCSEGCGRSSFRSKPSSPLLLSLG